MDDLFAPPLEPWLRISPKYATVRRIGSLISIAIGGGALAVLLWFAADWRWAVAALGLALAFAGWRWVRIGRWVRSWGYAERDDDLYLTRGLWFKSLTVVPYGRMQVVKVEAGPIERALGLASVQLITASVQTDARIPGLDEAEATRLRDRLTAIGTNAEDGL